MASGTQWRGKKAVNEAASASLNDEEVARVAYGLFERRGRVDGNDQQDWFEAERVVREHRRGRANR